MRQGIFCVSLLTMTLLGALACAESKQGRTLKQVIEDNISAWSHEQDFLALQYVYLREFGVQARNQRTKSGRESEEQKTCDKVSTEASDESDKIWNKLSSEITEFFADWRDQPEFDSTMYPLLYKELEKKNPEILKAKLEIEGIWKGHPLPNTEQFKRQRLIRVEDVSHWYSFSSKYEVRYWWESEEGEQSE